MEGREGIISVRQVKLGRKEMSTIGQLRFVDVVALF